MSLTLTAAHAGLGSMELEYDANKNPEIFQQLCRLDLKQVIHQVPAEPCYWHISSAIGLCTADQGGQNSSLC